MVLHELLGYDTLRIMDRVGKFDHARVWRQLGTLGGGNHFIEVCLDESQNVWVMLHSGSRGIGNVIGRHFIERARREMERSDTRLPDRDLAYLDELKALAAKIAEGL